MINIAQIVYSYWGPNLLRNLIANKECEVKIIIDLVQERRDFVRALYPAVAVSDDIQQVFNDSPIDAVVIATPVVTHFDFAILALKAVKHVLVKKLMAQSIAKVKQLGYLKLDQISCTFFICMC